MYPPWFLHAVTEALGVIVVVRVNVAWIVLVVVVVVYLNAKRVLVAVGKVVVFVATPENIVTGDKVDVDVVV